jgi:hypothetical protein
MTTENDRHVVFHKDDPYGNDVWMCASYAEAFHIWEAIYHSANPWLIATLGRVIDPATHR